uniref:coiled-coil domain-containing protein 80-like n=1 Tax=Myxine glutinosa TaxID=7769 RepID=UPI00358F7F4A
MSSIFHFSSLLYISLFLSVIRAFNSTTTPARRPHPPHPPRGYPLARFLAPLSGSRRLWVVSTPGHQDPYYRLMVGLMEPNIFCELAERSVTQVFIFWGGRNRARDGNKKFVRGFSGRLRHITFGGNVIETAIGPSIVRRFASFLKLKPGKFEMVLLRKNLRMHERYPYPVRMEAIFELIDRAPGRHLEKLRHREFVKKCRVAGVEGSVERLTKGKGSNRTVALINSHVTGNKSNVGVVRGMRRGGSNNRGLRFGGSLPQQHIHKQQPSSKKTEVEGEAERFAVTISMTTKVSLLSAVSHESRVLASPTPNIETFQRSDKYEKKDTSAVSEEYKDNVRVKSEEVKTEIERMPSQREKLPEEGVGNGREEEKVRRGDEKEKEDELITKAGVEREEGEGKRVEHSTERIRNKGKEEKERSPEVGEELEGDEYLEETDEDEKGLKEAIRTDGVEHYQVEDSEEPEEEMGGIEEEEEETSHQPLRKQYRIMVRKPNRQRGLLRMSSRRNRNNKRKNMNRRRKILTAKSSEDLQTGLGMQRFSGQTPNARMMGFLTPFRNRRRLLLISSSSADEPMYEQQRDAYLERACEMGMRHISVISLLGNHTHSSLSIEHFHRENETSLATQSNRYTRPWNLAWKLRQMYGLTDGEFLMALTDLDLKVKQFYEVPIGVQAIFDLVDTFPSRLREMVMEKETVNTCNQEQEPSSLENFLARFRWRRRLFAISAPSHESWAYQQQIYALNGQACVLGLRHIVVLNMLGEGEDASGEFLLYSINGTGTVHTEVIGAALVNDIRKYFQVGSSYFSMFLVGKDGNVKSWYPSPMWDMSTIFDLIDSMQLRQQEMGIQASLGLHCHMSERREFENHRRNLNRRREDQDK